MGYNSINCLEDNEKIMSKFFIKCKLRTIINLINCSKSRNKNKLFKLTISGFFLGI